MKRTDEAIIHSLLAFCYLARKRYCYPTQKKLLQVLDAFYDIKISRRQLNRDLKRLEAEGWFTRMRRLRKGGKGGLIIQSTLYCPSYKSWQRLLGLQRFIATMLTIFTNSEVKPKTERDMDKLVRLYTDNLPWVPVDLLGLAKQLGIRTSKILNNLH